MNISNGILSILEIPSDISYWLVRANGGTYYEDFFLNNFVSIGDNDITLNDLKDIKSRHQNNADMLQLYKELYHEKRAKQKWNPQQIAHAASRTFKFINEINKGDIVMVPSRRSERFVIGVIESDPFEITDNDIALTVSKFPIDRNHKRRKVRWIKEINRKDISDKLYWIFSAHQSIFCLNSSSNYINRLISPIYMQDNLFHGVIKINTPKEITSTDWYNFYSVTKSIDSITKSSTSVKTNVQSEGPVQFISENWVAIGAVISALIYGDIAFMGVKFRGIVPYFFNEGKLERESKRLENEKQRLENEKLKLELDELKNKFNKDKLSEPSQEVQNKLDITTFDAGKIIADQKQMGNDDYLDADKSE